jgi:hypothetical protein
VRILPAHLSVFWGEVYFLSLGQMLLERLAGRIRILR